MNYVISKYRKNIKASGSLLMGRLNLVLRLRSKH